jgi:acyl carrier protein
MRVRAAIISHFELVSKEQNKELQTLADNLALLDSGLDSLCFAIIVARLEDELGVDPFSDADDGDFPVTVGEFICMYETCLDKGKSL